MGSLGTLEGACQRQLSPWKVCGPARERSRNEVVRRVDEIREEDLEDFSKVIQE